MKKKLSTFQVFFGLFFINSAVVLLIVWIFFTFFSYGYYTRTITRAFIKDGINHEKQFKELGEKEYLDSIYLYEINKECRVILFDLEHNTVLYPTMGPRRGMGYGGQMEISELVNYVTDKLSISDSGNVFYMQHRKANMKTLVIFRKWENNIVWIIQTGEQPINRAVNIYQNLFVWFSIAALFCSSILAWILSNKITHNVSVLNQKVRSIASSAFDQSKKLSVGFSNELETLGTTLDTVSDQLKINMEALKETNLKLIHELNKEKQLDHIRKQFIADVSHDLKTPISIIQGYAEGLLDGVTDNPSEYIHAINDEAHNMQNLIGSLLELARVESEDIAVTFKKINVTELVKEMQKRFEILAKKNGRTIRFYLPAKPLWCDGNTIKLTQAFENLLKNSIVHSIPGTSIIVNVDVDSDKKEDILFSVYNDATPIPEKEIPFIFERFYKLDYARNRKTGGAGLGLAIVKNIVLKHNGDVGVVNEGDGVRFWIRIPSTLPPSEVDNINI